jgi:hypothetical protein
MADNREKTKILITKKTFVWIILLLILALVFSIISVVTIFCFHFAWNLEFVSQVLVISFLGALATFVVISNYMQVLSIKKEFTDEVDTKIKNIENKSIGTCLFHAANTAKNIDITQSFFLYFEALRHFLLADPIDESIKLCINELIHLINELKRQPFQLYKQQKDDMIKTLDEVNLKIKKNTQCIREFLNSCAIKY